MATKKHGGARKGSGRPPVPKELKMVRIVIQIFPHEKRFLEALAKDTGTSVAQSIRQGIELLTHTNNGKLALLTLKRRMK